MTTESLFEDTETLKLNTMQEEPILKENPDRLDIQ